MAVQAQVMQVCSSDALAEIAPKQPLVIFQKTKMCRFFEQGACSRGMNCKFAHSPSELAPMPDFSRTRLCSRMISKGFCDVEGCKFAHNKEQLRRRKPMQVELQAMKCQPIGSGSKNGKKNKAVAPKDTHAQLNTVNNGPQVDAMKQPVAARLPNLTVEVCESDEELTTGEWARSTTVGSSDSPSEWSSTPSESMSSGKSANFAERDEAPMSKPYRLHGFEITVKNSFLHFGPTAVAAPSSRRASSLSPASL
mmetsp:Transcript_57399/g.136431  ORF Transcript_57399/g.136431 Transcript_57399/m.136431 type:complete len:252 (-) Transcript_57399:175-930(-)|eukprot:CAMPEP_0178437790 /NCGR_PEP_ID=MMETSP0689_2-20121128/35201_1 /TAXON_ID=160604 /ORGANISM="Amphidinium massartii, Strain CS-259" /LENGTH=251 /DNA_ID=CAMNT_0020060057 /DNA_START=68 /DNA_END=823 /DNA_ORIENTATION=+